MVWSRRNTFLKRWGQQNSALKDISHLSKHVRKHAKLQMWLWSKRHKNVIFRMSTFKRRGRRNAFCSQPQVRFKTKKTQKKCETFGPSDVAAPKTSIDVCNGVEEKEQEMCKGNKTCSPSVSMVADFSAVHNTLSGAVNDLSLLSHNTNFGANADTVCPEAEQNEAEQNQAEQNQAEQSQAERNQAEQNQAEQNQAEQNEAEQNQAERNQAERSQAERNQAEQNQAEQNQAEQNQAERNQAERNQAERNQAERNQAERNQAEQNLTIDVVLTTENNAGDISIKIECPRQKTSKNVQEYLCDFHQKYGSFIPLEKNDIFEHLKEKSNKDLRDCEIMILEIIIEEMSKIVSTIPYLVKYKKHRLTLDDLSTLANDSWLNDQVINMYGELIMESADSKVHFLNSFFHKQLMDKGYEGVKRWTKQVDLFSKRLLLVPVHLEVHWCLVTADFLKKTVILYDSQGIGLQKVARNIVKYLLKEAKEKKQSAFEMGWTVSSNEEIPQQTNENDCGVFILEYSRCLALSEPLHFLQKDTPKIRKRIYKELCDRTLHKKG